MYNKGQVHLTTIPHIIPLVVISFGPGFGNIWLGISDNDKEGEWVSLHTKVEMSYTVWGDSEPNGGRYANCAMMWRKNGLWNDVKCTKKYRYLCKKRHVHPEEGR